MNLQKHLLTLLPLIVLFSLTTCKKKYGKKYGTTFLHLNGNIKSITENRTEHPELFSEEWQINFDQNRIKEVRVRDFNSQHDYNLFYDDEANLEHIYGHGISSNTMPNYSGDPLPDLTGERFESLFVYPLLSEADHCDTTRFNEYHDPVSVLITNKINSTTDRYEMTYVYDSMRNWVKQTVLVDSALLLIRERIIIYDQEISTAEIAFWKHKTDSLYKKSMVLYLPLMNIDSTIGSKIAELKQLNTFVVPNQEVIKELEKSAYSLNDQFDKKYGRERLSLELQQIQNKMHLLVQIVSREKSLIIELSIILPELINGTRKMSDKMEPFYTRYTLTYTSELIAEIAEAKSQYDRL